MQEEKVMVHNGLMNLPESHSNRCNYVKRSVAQTRCLQTNLDMRLMNNFSLDMYFTLIILLKLFLIIKATCVIFQF